METVACLGCCSLAPVVMINEDVYGSLSSSKVRSTLKKYGKE
jgi:NADH-quinone oxidoreductase subunit E